MLEQILKEFDERYSDSEVDGNLMKTALRENHRQFLKASLTRFARTIVEQSVPKTLDEEAYLSAGTSWNLCRSETLSNADNLLK